METPEVEELEAPLVEVVPSDGPPQLRVHMPEKEEVVIPESIVEGWLPEVQKALAKWDPWKVLRGSMHTGSIYKIDRWPDDMQVRVKDLFIQIIEMPDFQKGVIRGLLEIAPGNVTIERIIRVLTTTAGWVAWVTYCTQPRD
jgi:hypothetical protein